MNILFDWIYPIKDMQSYWQMSALVEKSEGREIGGEKLIRMWKLTYKIRTFDWISFNKQ